MPNTYESGFTTTLAQKLSAGDTSMYIATAPTVTTGRIYISSGTQEEWIKFTGVTAGSPAILTGLVRQLSKSANPATSGGSGYTFLAGTKIRLVAMHDQLPDEDIANMFEGDNTFSGTNSFQSTTKATWLPQRVTTAQRTALTGLQNGTIVYDTDLGSNYQYLGGSWYAVSAGSTQPDATTTVAGKVELATQTEFDAGTATGATGASLVGTPAQLYKSVGTATAKTTLADADAVSIMDSADSNINKKITRANTKTQMATDGVGDAFTTGSFLAGENISVGEAVCFANTEATTTVDYSAATGQTLNLGRTAGGSYVNLAFKYDVPATGNLWTCNNIHFWLLKQGSPTGNITVKVYSDDYITLMGTSSAIDGATLSGSMTEQTFTFSTELNLIPGRTYIFVLCRASAENDSNYYQVDCTNTGGSGRCLGWAGNDTNWVAAASADYEMRVTASMKSYTIDPTTVKKADANDTTKMNFVGIAKETKTTGQTIKVQTCGLVTGLTGLTPMAQYYISDTAGGIATTPGTYNLGIGQAQTSTTLVINKSMSHKKDFTTQANVTGLYNGVYNAGANNFRYEFNGKKFTVYTGFRPKNYRFYGGVNSIAATSAELVYGYSNGTTQHCIYNVYGSPYTIVSSTVDFFKARIVNATNDHFLSGTVASYDWGYEITYSKSSDATWGACGLYIFAEG